MSSFCGPPVSHGTMSPFYKHAFCFCFCSAPPGYFSELFLTMKFRTENHKQLPQFLQVIETTLDQDQLPGLAKCPAYQSPTFGLMLYCLDLEILNAF